MMERGQIVEIGSHESLIAEKGLYYNINQTLTEMELAASISSNVTSKSAASNIQEGGSNE
jgi:hypothetical protein